MKSLKYLLLLVCVVTLTHCKKSSGGEEVPDTEYIPLMTARAASLGPVVTASIGSGGGTLKSADGKTTIVVPAGAVSTVTTFGIQPVASTLDSGKIAYELTPHNVAFAKPVTIVLHYDQSMFTEGTEDVLQVAHQDEAGKWRALPTALDKVSKTLTVEKTDFSVVELYASYELNVYTESLQANKTTLISIGYFHYLQNDGDDLLTPLTGFTIGKTYFSPVSSQEVAKISNWRIVSGQGTLTPEKNGYKIMGDAQYKAPANVPFPSQVVVEVTIEGLQPIKDPSAPGGLRKIGKMILRGFIQLRPGNYLRLQYDGKDELITQAVNGEYTTGNIYLNAGNGVTMCQITLSAGAAGTYPCGNINLPGQALINLRLAGSGDYWNSQYTICPRTPANSAGQLVLTQFPKVLEPFVGHFSGTLYKFIFNGTNTCTYEAKQVAIEFSMTRNS